MSGTRGEVRQGPATPRVAAAAIVVRGGRTHVVAIPLSVPPRQTGVVGDAVDAVRAMWRKVTARASGA
jgi:hypothetical protein